jgi:hypothetical protein
MILTAISDCFQKLHQSTGVLRSFLALNDFSLADLPNSKQKIVGVLDRWRVTIIQQLHPHDSENENNLEGLHRKSRLYLCMSI